MSMNISHPLFERIRPLTSIAYHSHLILDRVSWLTDCYHHTGKAADMPLAAFVVMIFEAARQLRQTARLESTHIVLEDVSFLEALPLQVLQDPDTPAELHTTMWKSEAGYKFDIVSMHPSEESTVHHCQGSIRFSSSVEETELVCKTGPHDSFILEKTQALDWSLDPLRILQVSSVSVVAYCSMSKRASDYFLEPAVSNAALQLICLPDLGRIAPKVTRIESIGSLVLPVSLHQYGAATVEVRSSKTEKSFSLASKCSSA